MSRKRNPPPPAQPTTILMQYAAIKKQYPGVILLFRLDGKFVAFQEDAQHLATCFATWQDGEILEGGEGAAITKVAIPAVSAETHIAMLIADGHKVAICEQIGTGRNVTEQAPW